MSRCLVRERRTALAYRDGLEAHTLVETVDVLPPKETPTGHWELDVLLVPSADGLPPSVGEYCGRHGLTVRTVQPQADHWQAVVAV
jgi:hypothetical protein